MKKIVRTLFFLIFLVAGFYFGSAGENNLMRWHNNAFDSAPIQHVTIGLSYFLLSFVFFFLCVWLISKTIKEFDEEEEERKNHVRKKRLAWLDDAMKEQHKLNRQAARNKARCLT